MAYWFQVCFLLFIYSLKIVLFPKNKNKKSQLNHINIAASPTYLLSLNSLNTI